MRYVPEGCSHALKTKGVSYIGGKLRVGIGIDGLCVVEQQEQTGIQVMPFTCLVSSVQAEVDDLPGLLFVYIAGIVGS